MDMFVRWERAGEFAPTAAELVQAADEIRRRELERIGSRLEAMSPEERSVIDHLTRRIVAKILHTPLTKARELANSKQGYVYLAALRELFELDDES
jgi:glutamyl-tRNA reductase